MEEKDLLDRIGKFLRFLRPVGPGALCYVMRPVTNKKQKSVRKKMTLFDGSTTPENRYPRITVPHSCIPSAIAVFDPHSGNIGYFTTGNIKEDTILSVSRSPVLPLLDTFRRRKYLAETCECEKCIEDDSPEMTQLDNALKELCKKSFCSMTQMDRRRIVKATEDSCKLQLNKNGLDDKMLHDLVNSMFCLYRMNQKFFPWYQPDHSYEMALTVLRYGHRMPLVVIEQFRTLLHDAVDTYDLCPSGSSLSQVDFLVFLALNSIQTMCFKEMTDKYLSSRVVYDKIISFHGD